MILTTLVRFLKMLCLPLIYSIVLCHIYFKKSLAVLQATVTCTWATVCLLKSPVWSRTRWTLWVGLLGNHREKWSLPSHYFQPGGHLSAPLATAYRFRSHCPGEVQMWPWAAACREWRMEELVGESVILTLQRVSPWWKLWCRMWDTGRGPAVCGGLLCYAMFTVSTVIFWKAWQTIHYYWWMPSS